MFIAVMETGSFIAAAARLDTSSSQASKLVSRLESELGVRLLSRTTRAVSPTEAGQAYFDRLRPLLEEFDDLEASIRDASRAPRGRLRLTAPLTFGTMGIGPALNEFAARFPEIELEVVFRVAHDLRSAWEASQASDSRINAWIAEALATFDAVKEGDRPLNIDLDVGSSTPGRGWPGIMQDVVRRSSSLDEVVVHSAFTCSKMYSDGFGGGVMRITADRIQYASTFEMLESMRAAVPSISDARSGHDGHPVDLYDALCRAEGFIRGFEGTRFSMV